MGEETRAAGETGIQIALVQGSVREGNYTSKALALVVDEIEREGAEATLIDLARLRLPSPGSDPDSESARRLREQIAGATGVVLATPEYHGSYSSAIKLAIENLGFPSALAAKPVALLGVAAGEIGAIKALEHLRSVCSHVGAIVLPGPVSVARVQSVFAEDGRCLDAKAEKRIRGLAVGLLGYIRSAICPRMASEQMVREREG